jgi:hypothetical protein
MKAVACMEAQKSTPISHTTLVQYDKAKQEIFDLKKYSESLDLRLEENRNEREHIRATNKKELEELLLKFSENIAEKTKNKLDEFNQSVKQQQTIQQQEYKQLVSALATRINGLEKKQAQQKSAFKSIVTWSAGTIAAGLLLWLWHYTQNIKNL